MHSASPTAAVSGAACPAERYSGADSRENTAAATASAASTAASRRTYFSRSSSFRRRFTGSSGSLGVSRKRRSCSARQSGHCSRCRRTKAALSGPASPSR